MDGGAVSALSRLLNEVNDLNPMSLRKRAARIGDRISYATIGDYQRGTHAERPDGATLLALAEAYDLDLADVQAAAGVGVGAGPWEPPAEVTQLSRRQQDAITELIMSMVERGGSSDGRMPEAEKTDDDAPASGSESGNVRRLTPRQERMLGQGQPVERAADSNPNVGRGLRDQMDQHDNDPDPDGPEFGA